MMFNAQSGCNRCETKVKGGDTVGYAEYECHAVSDLAVTPASRANVFLDLGATQPSRRGTGSFG